MTTDSKKMDNPPDVKTGDEAFLSRWSRRKREMQQTKEEVVLTEDNSSEIQTVLLTDADMPPLESLDEHSDYTGFLSPKVSEVLRKQALRKLFHSPGFNIRDGLDDYDDDYTQFAKLGDMITADMQHRLEKQAASIEEKLSDEIAAQSTELEPVEIEGNPDSTASKTPAEQNTGNDTENEKA